MENRHIAIGDIHGEIDQLKTLIQLINPTANDVLIFLGDYIDRGSNSKDVIDYLVNLQEICKCVFVKGNHEDFFLAAVHPNYTPSYNYLPPLDVWIYNGGFDTLISYEIPHDDRENIWEKYLPESHKQFFNGLLNYYETDDFVFVHAGVTNDPPDQTDAYTLLWHLFSSSEEYKYHKTLVHGHKPSRDAMVKVKINSNNQKIICIDTGCGKYGCLTGYEINTKEIWRSK